MVTIATLVADAVRSIMRDPGTGGKGIDELAELIGSRAHAWVCDYDLAKVTPAHTDEAAAEAKLWSAAGAYVHAREIYGARAAVANIELRRLLSNAEDRLKRAAVEYGEPLRTEEALKLRKALDAVGNRLAHARDCLTNAEGYISSAGLVAERGESD